MVFHEVSADLLKWIHKQPNVKEESLTDRLLYEISEKTDRFIYKTFTKNEESYTGVDWEWWVLTAEPIFKAYRFLIQAKKLKSDESDKYAQLCYANRNGLQIDLLLNTAMKNRAMPLYIFYSSDEIDPQIQFEGAELRHRDIVRWCDLCNNGAYFALASHVRSMLFDKGRCHISSKLLLSHSLKLSLLDLLLESVDDYGHITRNDNNSPDDYMREIDRLYRKNSGIEIMYTFKDVPNYLRVLIEQRQGIDQWFETEFSDLSHRHCGIAIFDLRPDIHRKSKK